MNPIGIWADEDDTLTIANTYANQYVLGKKVEITINLSQH